jgi:hypothetical protein
MDNLGIFSLHPKKAWILFAGRKVATTTTTVVVGCIFRRHGNRL